MSKVIGIDLGTTNSCVAVMDLKEPKVINNEDQSKGFKPKKNISKYSLLNIWLSIWYKNIRIIYPIDFDIKNVCTPNINIPTNPLSIPIYLAPLKPIDNLRITGKDSPVLCEVLPIMFVRIKINNVAIKHPDKTIIEFKSYNK